LAVDSQKILDDATNNTNDKKKQLRAQQWSTGLESLNSYINGFQKNTTMVDDPAHPGSRILVKTDANGKPIQNQAPDGTTSYVTAGPLQSPHWADALRILTGQVRMSKHDALLMMSASQFPSWRAEANRQLHPTKRVQKPGPTNQGGSPAHTGAGYP